MTKNANPPNDEAAQRVPTNPIPTPEGIALKEHPVRISTQGTFELAPDDDLPIHPAAAAFPVSDKDLETMSESFSADGQWDPVIVFENQILDGQKRNHVRKRLGLPLRCMRIADLGGLTPQEWAIRRNLAAGTARHLSDSQRAMIGARLCRDVYEKEAKDRMRAGKDVPPEERGRASERAARVVAVKTNLLRQGLKVHDAGWAELFDAVWRGIVAISVAAQIAELPAERDRKRALAAAVTKDREALRKICRSKRGVRDGLGNQVGDRGRAAFLAAAHWDRQIKQLGSVAQWLQSIRENPEARVLREAVRVETLDEIIHSVEAAKPWVQCAYCEHFGADACPVCDGTGFLTRLEHEATMRRYAESLGNLEADHQTESD